MYLVILTFQNLNSVILNFLSSSHNKHPFCILKNYKSLLLKLWAGYIGEKVSSILRLWLRIWQYLYFQELYLEKMLLLFSVSFSCLTNHAQTECHKTNIYYFSLFYFLSEWHFWSGAAQLEGPGWPHVETWDLPWYRRSSWRLRLLPTGG